MHKIWARKTDFFTRFLQKQLPINDGTKNFTPTARGIIRGTNEFTFTYVCVSGRKKCSFFGKFGVLCFLETLVSRFALLPQFQSLNHYTKDNVDLRFSATVWFCQILEHFLWVWEAGVTWIKFYVKSSIILASQCTSVTAAQ